MSAARTMNQAGLPDPALWRALADAADAETLARFRGGGRVENKLAREGADDGAYDPVTEADREAERALRDVLARERPADAILGEEHGASEGRADEAGEGRADGASEERAAGRSPYRWVIDPIDGTRAFVAGLPVWMTLVGLEREGRAVAGLASQPVTGERFLAPGDGTTRLLTRGGERRLHASGTADPAVAIAMTTDPFLLDTRPGALDAIRGAVRLTRYGTDAYAFCALAAGSVDLVFEHGVQPYDVCALIPIVEAAGGTVTDWSGGPAEAGGSILAAASAELHAWALERLAPHA